MTGRISFTESQIPPHLKLVVNHWHEGNSTRRFRHKAEYMTEAKLFPRTVKDVRNTEPLAVGYSYCGKKDTPSRKIGRAIAVGRALKEYFMHFGHEPPF